MTAQEIVGKLNKFHISLIEHLRYDPGLYGEMKGTFCTELQSWGVLTVGPERAVPGGRPNIDWAEVDLTDLGKEVLDILFDQDKFRL